MGQEYAIEVQDVYKSFKVYYDKSNQLREKVLFHNRNRFEVREILKGISFQVKKGEAIGLIGKNGCGKSTTLKMLTRILKPNAGTIKMNGRVSSLIELGAGFHPDMTGRENIYINASIFGIKKKEVDERLERIIRFSELEDFIDNPVRTYSSGMYMRLAFSVAINVDADILLIDEILAVGDQAFQEKCFQKLKALKDEGTTIVIVSHSLDQIEKICDRCVWIEKGVIKEIGETNKICKEYKTLMNEIRKARAKEEALVVRGKKRGENISESEKQRISKEELNATCWDVTDQCCADAHREQTGTVYITKAVMKNKQGDKALKFATEDDICIEVEYECSEPGVEINFGISITRTDWVYCSSADIKRLSQRVAKAKNKGKASLYISRNLLMPGSYYLDVAIYGKEFETRYDYLYSIMRFEIENTRWIGSGILKLDYKWVVDGEEYEYLP